MQIEYWEDEESHPGGLKIHDIGVFESEGAGNWELGRKLELKGKGLEFLF